MTAGKLLRTGRVDGLHDLALNANDRILIVGFGRFDQIAPQVLPAKGV